MRQELMDDLKEFEENQAELEEYMSNGIIAEENTIQDSVEMMSVYSYGLENDSELNTSQNSKITNKIKKDKENTEIEKLMDKNKQINEELQIEKQKSKTVSSQNEILQLEIKHLNEKSDQEKVLSFKVFI